MRIGSLFAGIGGFDLAAQWMGWETAWFSEIDPYASAVLAKHWPGVPNHGDITRMDFATVEPVDLLCGGFPCQDISNAGQRKGIEGERSGLWTHFARAIGELRPRYVVVENVAALLVRGLDRVLGDLAALGYDAEWEVLSAASVGAPHLRERLWIVAYPDRQQYQVGSSPNRRPAAADLLAHTPPQLLNRSRDAGPGRRTQYPDRCSEVAHAQSSRLEEQRLPAEGRGLVVDPTRGGGLRQDTGIPWDWWTVEPDVGRVAHGIPSRVDRLACLGNAIVPLCAYLGPFQVVAEIEAMKRGVA